MLLNFWDENETFSFCEIHLKGYGVLNFESVDKSMSWEDLKGEVLGRA